MSAISKCRWMFLANMGGWLLLFMPRLPGEEPASDFTLAVFAIFNFLCIIQCFIWQADDRL